VADPAAKTVSIDGQVATIAGLPASARAGDSISLTTRPEAISLANVAPREIVLDATVSEVAFLGSVIRLKVKTGSNELALDLFNDQRSPPPGYGETVRITIAASDILVLGD
jgi:putative spermidine/putrescine transport system ATP-binding protein